MHATDASDPTDPGPGHPPAGPAPAHPPAAPTTTIDSQALAILSAELSSLVASRGLVYNESFTRAGMFLAFLSATLVALGLVATATGLGDQLLLITAGVLAVDLFIGLATLGRLVGASREDLRCIQGMNRVRHAFHELRPDLARYFVTGRHDDMRGILATYGPADTTLTQRRGILHGFTTMPAMLSVICACLAATIAGALLLLVTHSPEIAALGMIITLAGSVVASVAFMIRSIAAGIAALDVAFPSSEG